MNPIIIWEQEVACWKLQRDIAFLGDKFFVIVDLFPLLIKQKQGLIRREVLIKRNKAKKNTGSKKTLTANGVFCLGNTPVCVN